MIKVYLHGGLKEFGECYEFSATTPQHVMSALINQLPGFRKRINEGRWHLVVGKAPTPDGVLGDASVSLDETELDFQLGSQKEFHLIPEIVGAKDGSTSGGILKTVVGITLMAVAVVGTIFFSGATAFPGAAALWGTLGALGTTMTITGISRLLSPKVVHNAEPSFLFQGASNSTQQGVPVPVVYGRMIVGSIVVSVGIDAEISNSPVLSAGDVLL
jgi:predicted phage tail protein